MSECTATGFAPPFTFSAESWRDPATKILSADQQYLVAYCPRHRVGGVYRLDPGLWAIYTPLSAQEFLGSLQSRGIALPEGWDLQRWLDAIADTPAAH